MKEEIKNNFYKKESILSDIATKSSEAVRLREEESDFRTPFFRDVDRIINYSSFTRYSNKTQVFSFLGNDNIQTLSVVYAPDVNNSNDSRNPYIKVVHKQNGVPEYYTSYGYISVPLNDFALGTTIHLSVNTYDKGWITKDLVIK